MAGSADMDVTVFDAMDLTSYIFLEIDRGTAEGNKVVEYTEATGVFKLRSAMVRDQNSEAKESNSTLHIRPEESFLASLDNNLVGHGVRVYGKDYEIIGQTGGMNYDNGVMEHYTATLQETEFAEEES